MPQAAAVMSTFLSSKQSGADFKGVSRALMSLIVSPASERIGDDSSEPTARRALLGLLGCVNGTDGERRAAVIDCVQAKEALELAGLGRYSPQLAAAAARLLRAVSSDPGGLEAINK